MTRKKLSARIISFLSVLAMIFTLMPNGLTAFAADIQDCISYEITYFGLQPDENGVVENGTSFSVSLKGVISSEYTDNVVPLQFTIPIDTNGVKLSGSGPIPFAGGTIGTYSFDENGNILVTIDERGKGFIDQGNRSFNIDFSATVDVDETADGSAVNTQVKVGERAVDVIVQFPDSYLSGEKFAAGDAWYDPDTDEVYQKYIIRQTAYNGNVTDVDIYDYFSEWLSGPVDDEVKITYDVFEKLGSSWVDIQDGVVSDKSGFSVHIDEIRKGETIEIEYTLIVSKDYFASDDDSDSRGLNLFGKEYTDQNGNKHDPSPEGWVPPNVERPGVTKSGEFTVKGDEVVWTIKVDAGIFESCDDFIADFGIVVTDKPGEGLVDNGKDVVLPSYENNGDGTYTFTYTTKVTTEIIEQLEDISKTVSVHNDVEAGNTDFKFEGTADATRIGIGILDKHATATEADSDGRFAWESILTVPVEGIKDLIFTDSTASSPNGHKIVKDTMEIDGISVAELEAAGKVTVTVSGKQLVVRFSNEYLAELQNKNRRAHTVEGYEGVVYLADIAITYLTEPDEPSDLSDSYTFTNQSDIEYTMTDSGKKITGSDSDDYVKIVEAKKYFSKQELQSWTGMTGDWELTLDVMLDELSVGDVFRITDTPNDMEIIEESIIPYIHLNSWSSQKVSELYDDVDSFLTFLDNNDGTYTFTFTVTQELYDAAYGALSWESPSSVYFSIAYSTRITNPEELAETSVWEGLEYTNSADGTFNGKPSEQVTATKTFYNQEPVSKSFIYDVHNDEFEYGVSNGKINARFAVTINPNATFYGENDYLYLTDTMSDSLIMIPASVVLTDKISGNILTNGVDYFISFNEANNEMNFTVPNGRSMILTYMAEIAGDAPENQDEAIAFSAGNTIELYINDTTSYSSFASKSGNIFKASASANAEGYSITVAKTSEFNGTTLFPEGAEFEVVRVSYNESTGVFEDYTDNMQGENISVSPIEGTNLTMIIGLVPDAIYRLTEINPPEGYVLSSDSIYFMYVVNDTNPNPSVIKDFQNMEVVYFNNDPDFGGLKITKTVDGKNITDAELRGALEFTIKNDEGKYVDANGELHDSEVKITLRSFKKQRDGSFVLTFTQLPTGNYTVTETNSEIDGYRLISNISTTSDAAEVKQGEISTIALKDCYEEAGNLKITKSVDGLNVTDEEKAGALKFTVQNEDGKYLDEKGNLHNEKVEITLDKFTKQNDGTYVLEFKDIATGMYTVTETNTAIDGYKFIREDSKTSDKTEVKQSDTSTVALKDSYEKAGNLKITKSVDGLNVTDEEKAGALKFTVKNEDGKYLDEKGNLHAEKVEITLDKFTKQNDGTYVLEFKNIATGKYTVTETNTAIDGYKFIREDSKTSDTAEVKQSDTSTVALKDSYEEIGNLKITKTVDAKNITDEELNGALKFTVQNEDGKYLDEKGNLHAEKVEITLDKFTKQNDGTYVLEFKDIATGKYTVTETNTAIDGYKFIREASKTSDKANVEQSKTSTIALKDSYEEIGNLKITKTVDAKNITDEELNGALKFTVKRDDGKYLDENGGLHDDIVEITLDKFTKQDDGTYVLEFKNIATGKYTVAETDTEIAGYEFTSIESVTGGEAVVTKGKTAELDLKDTYEEIGNLKITKTVDAKNITDEELNGALKFTVQNEDEKYLDENGDLHDDIVEITLDKFTKQEDGTYVLEFKDIATGKYTVTETDTEIEGYRFTSSESVTEGEAAVTKGQTAKIDLKDSYEEIGNLKITKSIDGLNVTDEEKSGALKFTVQNEDGKYLDENGDLHDDIVEITLDKFTKQEDGTYVLELTNIVAGKYTVTETNTDIAGYKLISDTSVTSGITDVTKGETADISLKDNYYKTTSVTINKKDIANDEEIEGAKLEIFDKDNNKVGEWISEKGKTHTIDGLKPGEKYTLRETITPDDYETATDIVFTVDENGNVTVESGKDGSVDKDGVLIVNNTKITEDDDSEVSGSVDGDDKNPQTGYSNTDVITMLLLTGATLVAMSAKKRREDEE